MKLMGFDNVLCLSPHPDDVEYAMSGTVKKYKDTKFEILVMSLGTKTDSNDGRWAEVNKFWAGWKPEAVVSLVQGLTFDFSPPSEWTSFMDNFFKGFDAVFGPTHEDTHYEHKLANEIMWSFARARPMSVIEYRCISTTHAWQPNMFVPLTAHDIGVKRVELCEAFESQLDSPYFTAEAIAMFHRDFLSYKKGLEYVEQFRIVDHYTKD